MCTCVYASAVDKPVEDSREVVIDFPYKGEVDKKNKKERLFSVIYLVDDISLSLEASSPVVYEERPPVLASVRFEALTECAGC